MTKYIAISLNDEKTEHLASVLSNKTAKKVLNLLADKDASETDLSTQLGVPLNTIEYSIKNLEKAGLIEKAKEFFWSRKGKKIAMYKLANKSILISTKQKIKGILPTALITLIAAFGIKLFFSQNYNTALKAAESTAPNVASAGATMQAVPDAIQTATQLSQTNLLWLFFLLGSLTALLVYLIINSFRRKNGE